MTTRTGHQPAARFRLPAPPRKEPDEVTAYHQIYRPGHPEDLDIHFGQTETTIIGADLWIVANPEQDKSRAKHPDLMIAFNADPEAYRLSNGYIVSEQGKPPDFVMEVASPSTAAADVGEKRDYYAEMGIPEYWRFDETGQFHGQRLAGDRLVGDSYVSIPVMETAQGALEGYSEALNLILRWDQGRLAWIDPATGTPIASHRRTLEERNRERAGREQAEERARQLEEELRRLREDIGNQ